MIKERICTVEFVGYRGNIELAWQFLKAVFVCLMPCKRVNINLIY